MEFFAKEDYSDDEDYDGGRSSGDGGADTAVPFVEWTFVSGDVVETLAARGVSLSARWSAQRRASTNFVNDMTVIEEHYLVLGEATMKDTGVYICRVSEQQFPEFRALEVVLIWCITGWEMICLLMHLNPPPFLCPVPARGRETRKRNFQSFPIPSHYNVIK